MCAFRNYPRRRFFRAPKGRANWSLSKKPYYFKDNVVYTEDHILVRKLFLMNVTPALTPKQMKAHFNRFGRVERLQVSDQDNKTPKTGYVIFNDPRSAAKALRRKIHHVYKGRLAVQPGESWLQPDAANSTLGTPSEPLARILQLNDLCLEQIVRLLSSSDRVHFARCCERFRNIYQLVSPIADKSVNLNDFAEMTLWDVRDFFMLSGSNIKHIDGILPQRHAKRIFDFLDGHCKNLSTLCITNSKLNVANVQRMLNLPKPLQQLQLRDCDLRNGSVLVLRHLQQLKQLDLSHNGRLTGRHLDCLPASIESLKLTSCTGMQPRQLSKAWKALTQLKQLNVKGIHMNTIGLSVKEAVCNALETITISNSNGLGFNMIDQYEHIAKLPSLKKLIVHSQEENRYLCGELLRMLVAFKSVQLEHFETNGENCLNPEAISQISQLKALRKLIVPQNEAIGDRELEMLAALHDLEEIDISSCPNVGDNGLLRLVIDCPKLQLLHLQHCPNLTDKLLTNIVFKLRQITGIQRSLPIRLNFYGSNIDQLCAQGPWLAAKDIIDARIAPPSLPDVGYFDISELLTFDDYYIEERNMGNEEIGFSDEFEVNDIELADLDGDSNDRNFWD